MMRDSVFILLIAVLLGIFAIGMYRWGDAYAGPKGVPGMELVAYEPATKTYVFYFKRGSDACYVANSETYGHAVGIACDFD